MVRPSSLHLARGRERPVSLDTSVKAASTALTAVLPGWLLIDLSNVAPRSAAHDAQPTQPSDARQRQERDILYPVPYSNVFAE